MAGLKRTTGKVTCIVSAITSIQKLHKSASNAQNANNRTLTVSRSLKPVVLLKSSVSLFPTSFAKSLTLHELKRENPLHIFALPENSHALKPQLTCWCSKFQLSPLTHKRHWKERRVVLNWPPSSKKATDSIYPNFNSKIRLARAVRLINIVFGLSWQP